MAKGQHQSIQNPQLLPCSTSKVEHLNLPKSYRANIFMLSPLSIEKPFCHYALPPHQEQMLPYSWPYVLKGHEAWA